MNGKKSQFIKDDAEFFEHFEKVKKGMPKLLDKKMKVNSIGDKLVRCKYCCEGITNKPSKGIVPRCLIFEGRIGKDGAIVVGLNPGKAKENEQSYYLKNNNTYNAVEDYWENKIQHHQYYKKIRELLSKFGFEGSILWTELVKCECSGENGVIPIQTMRTCINTYLKSEIELFPDYTIFGVGNTAFEFCALSFPNHFIIGIPHPTGSFGNFTRLINNIQVDRQKYLDKLSNKKDRNERHRALKVFE